MRNKWQFENSELNLEVIMYFLTPFRFYELYNILELKHK